jgi:hypothetical protein
LLVEGPHVRGGSARRGSQFADECLLRDLRQIAKAILTTRVHMIESLQNQRPDPIATPAQAQKEREGLLQYQTFGDSQEEHVEHEAEAEDGQVDPLDCVERGGVLALEEVRRGDERAREGRDALEALADVEPHRGVARGAEHGDVRVGGHLEAGEAAADDEGAAHETAVLLELGARPEKDGT